MAKKEVKTDLQVYDLLKQADIQLDAQGSNIKEIDEALKTASKKGTGNVGFPEYVGVVKDYLLVIEDKASLSKHIKLDNKNCTPFFNSIIIRISFIGRLHKTNAFRIAALALLYH